MDPGVVARFRALPDLVLGPLAGRDEPDWHRAPAGKWDAAQIVEHLCIALEMSGEGLAGRLEQPPAARRARTPRQLLAQFLVLAIGWVPPGTRAPAVALPPAASDPDRVARRFRTAVARFLALQDGLDPERERGLYLKHPILGDLSLAEWHRFHLWHCRHHARQIRGRLGRG